MDAGGLRPVSKSHLIVVGAGGNIGSHLVPHLARLPNIGWITLVDEDIYEPSNLTGQAVTRRDIGKPKAVVQANRLRTINRALRISTWTTPVQALPLGELRADAIFSCLDSRIARQYVNECAWRLGVPLIDAAVDGGQLLARVNVYEPTSESPCLECGWSEDDYAALEQSYPCGNHRRPQATRAPSALGALAAAMQALECQKLLTRQPAPPAAGKQILLDLAHHRQYVTSLRRNPACRLVDHRPWSMRTLEEGAADLAVADVLQLAGQGETCGLGIAGRRFTRRRICGSCGLDRREARFVDVVPGRCPRCRGAITVVGSETTEELAPGMNRRFGRRSLASLGARDHDVLVIRRGGERLHFEIGGERQ
jgi:molybdopterin/thiamine biosynthesis adenylyltransferase